MTHPATIVGGSSPHDRADCWQQTALIAGNDIVAGQEIDLRLKLIADCVDTTHDEVGQARGDLA